MGSIKHVLTDKTVVTTGECVDVGHHASRAMDDSEMVTEQFLGPAADDVDLTIVIENLLHRTAIANPIEHSAPKIFLVLGNTPATTSGFTNEGVKVTFLLSTFAGIESHGAQTGAFEC